MKEILKNSTDVKNLSEGSEREATSMQNVLKLLDVAKAILYELRDDYRIGRMSAARGEARRDQKLPVAEDAPTCPRCGAVMRLRRSAHGYFWGCTAYPTCKATRQIPSPDP